MINIFKIMMAAFGAALILSGCSYSAPGNIAGAIASIYGYKTIGGLIAANSGLIIIISAFVGVCLVFRVLLNRQFPSGARQPAKVWIFKTTIIFFICAFVFICGFTVFYEKKKHDAQSSAPSFIENNIEGGNIESS